MLRLHLLGATRILLDDRLIGRELPAKSLALLAYLAMSGRPHSRLFLAGLLWPEKDDQGARMNLRQALRQLRLNLPEYVQATRESIGLNPDLALEVDALQFEAEVRTGLAGDMARLQSAMDRYAGEFLSGFFVDDALDFESWLLLEQERLRSLAMQGLQQLSGYYVSQGDSRRGLPVAHRLLAMEPLHESSYRQMMKLLAWDGQIGAALAQYENCRQILLAELGVEPSPETTALYEEIRSGALRPPEPPAAFDRTAGQTRPDYNLPRTFTRFVGRQAEIERLSAWLADPACALITLRGPGGVGKTRLAIEAARHNLSQYPDGAWFVDLAPVNRPENLFLALAAGLGMTPPAQANIKARVLNHLKDRRSLLILDNFEHLTRSARELMAILQQAPDVQIMVTSRESLNLSAEWLFQADGLAYTGGPEGQMAPAMSLFVERVGQWRSGSVPGPADLEAIAHICSLLDGMPLAIELAASLSRSLSYPAIALAIERDQDVLTTRRSDVPERHRSLRAVFESSWLLLGQREQAALSGLAVFSGDFSILAACAVTDAPDAVLNDLQRKSFLFQSTSGRYQLHELLQQYAGEKAEALDPARLAHRRHSAFYLDFLHQREQAILGPDARLALTEIRRDLANIRLAWRWAALEGDGPALERGRTALAAFCRLSGLFEEGAVLFETAVDGLREALAKAGNLDAVDQRVLARLLAEWASFMDSLSQYDQALELAGQAVDLALACQDAYGAARANHVWGLTLIHRGDHRQAEMFLDKGLELASAAGLDHIEAAILNSKGVLRFYLADYAIAQRHLEQAQALYQTLGDLAGEGSSINNRAIIQVRMGDYVRALPLYEKSLAIRRQIGDRGGEILATANLGIAASLQGDFVIAEERLLDALAGCREIGERRVESAVLNSLGANRLQQADYDGAQEHFMQALRLARLIGNQNTESEVLSNLGLLAHWRSEWPRALDHSLHGLRLAEVIGEQTMAGFAWMGVGRAQEALGDLGQAAEAYRQALLIRQASSWLSAAAETQAALARVLWQQQQAKEALALAEEVVSCLNREDVGPEHSLDGTQEPGRVYLTCYQILLAVGDRRPQDILEQAVRFLHHRASRVVESRLRQAFLSLPPGHAELLAEMGRQRDQPAG
jgi:predicted ATPase/DNA-binding SARP family transcriptional activator